MDRSPFSDLTSATKDTESSRLVAVIEPGHSRRLDPLTKKRRKPALPPVSSAFTGSGRGVGRKAHPFRLELVSKSLLVRLVDDGLATILERLRHPAILVGMALGGGPGGSSCKPPRRRPGGRRRSCSATGLHPRPSSSQRPCPGPAPCRSPRHGRLGSPSRTADRSARRSCAPGMPRSGSCRPHSCSHH